MGKRETNELLGRRRVTIHDWREKASLVEVRSFFRLVRVHTTEITLGLNRKGRFCSFFEKSI